MIQRRVQIVDTDRIDTQSLHEGRISQAESAVAKRIFTGACDEASGASWLIARDTSADEDGALDWPLTLHR